jgi:hypothetical protein
VIKKSHKAVMAWFQDTYHHFISQSSVSEILSDRYARLDVYKKAEKSGEEAGSRGVLAGS